MTRAIRPSFVVYGPPGSGKSTTVTWASERGILALDLESEWPTLLDTIKADPQRFQHYRLIGAAGMSISDGRLLFPEHFHVLLLPSRDELRARRRPRDQAHPSKAKQPELYTEFAADGFRFDSVVPDVRPLLFALV